jgi:uncharacterized protein YjbI with pentapeptide repeats
VDTSKAERLLAAYARGERNFSHWDLEGVDLSGANLAGADLTNANLRRAILRRAILHDADLHEADLEGADLTGTHLHGANLHHTVLEDVNFELAHLRGPSHGWEAMTGLPVQHEMGEGD